jgi:hypothetical protein
MKCQNCQRLLSCGCEVKVASDGKRVCTKCASSYESALKAKVNNVQVSLSGKLSRP